MFLRQRQGNDKFIKQTSHPIQVPDVQLILSMRTFFTVSLQKESLVRSRGSKEFLFRTFRHSFFIERDVPFREYKFVDSRL